MMELLLEFALALAVVFFPYADTYNYLCDLLSND